jgi:hypothetical protein
VLVQNHLGQTQVLHKDNLQRCPTRTFESFSSLPLTIKKALGFPFDPKYIADQVRAGTLDPSEWKIDTTEKATGVKTRKQTDLERKEAMRPAIFSASEESSDSNDDDDDDDDILATKRKTVRFNDSYLSSF